MVSQLIAFVNTHHERQHRHRMDRVDLEPADRLREDQPWREVPGTWAFAVSWLSRRELLDQSTQIPGTLGQPRSWQW